MRIIIAALLALALTPAAAFGQCLVLGDSIAVGLSYFMPRCTALAKGGWNSWQYNRGFPGEFNARLVIISLGSNDHIGVRTAAELARLRDRVWADRVVWIAPAGNLPASRVPIATVQGHIAAIAAAHGDVVLPITGLSPDRIHPSWAGYRALKESIAP